MRGAHMNIQRAQWAYRALFVACIVWASIHAILDVGAAAHAKVSGVSVHFIDALAGTEILAALLFLLPRLQLVGAILLEFVFVVAMFHEIVSRVVPASLIFYAGTVVFLVRLSRETAARP
ncbi:hypothetical protein [Gluconacetobacter takamatsuzukensis]|uniref:DoxX family protein n=1 Tax=Gluconacetobacter takamatsuzukensis TaxID=1286190 RepID=A0A7W4KGF6_9PROT|nr:hypothetical protein [Gluconacetobacter takamatsuzukensis]MBB2206509.1 hypothetical protein [Gluconacetobacter takamatsuzukensis]